MGRKRPRLDQARQADLEPKRMGWAVEQLMAHGIDRANINIAGDGKSLRIEHDGKTITFWPYSGWASGKGITDGRGLQNLLKQL